VISGESTVGGGSLPGETLPTSLFALEVRGSARFMQRLRTESQTPVIARLLEEKVVFDPRTVLPEQDDILLDCIRRLLS
jgi:L-seryl-tRNA(Ser) seleniumtransferase